MISPPALSTTTSSAPKARIVRSFSGENASEETSVSGIPSDRADHRQRRAGAAAGELDHPPAAGQVTASLRAVDDRQRHPILVAAPTGWRPPASPAHRPRRPGRRLRSRTSGVRPMASSTDVRIAVIRPSYTRADQRATGGRRSRQSAHNGGVAAAFVFDATWTIAAPAQAVYEVLAAPDDYPRWWPQIRWARRIDADSGELGARSRLPYTLRMTVRREVEDPGTLTLLAALTGDLVGFSRWQVSPAPAGDRARRSAGDHSDVPAGGRRHRRGAPHRGLAGPRGAALEPLGDDGRRRAGPAPVSDRPRVTPRRHPMSRVLHLAEVTDWAAANGGRQLPALHPRIVADRGRLHPHLDGRATARRRRAVLRRRRAAGRAGTRRAGRRGGRLASALGRRRRPALPARVRADPGGRRGCRVARPVRRRRCSCCRT